MPVLGSRIGSALAAGEFAVDTMVVPGFEGDGEVPVLTYFDHVFPIRPGTEDLPLDELLERVDFLSVGSNDLFQFMFAVDRGNSRVADRFDTHSAPILRALRDIAVKANAAKVPLSLCGEMASQPLGALALLAMGYRNLSLSATAHGPVKAMILDLDIKKAAATMKALLDAPSGSVAVGDRLREFAEAEGLSL